MSRRILVTGGAGFIGSHIVDALVRRGDQVRVLDDLSTGRRENLAGCIQDVEVVIGDVRDRETVARALDGVEGVFHEAAVASVVRSVEQPEETSAVNALGTVNVLSAAARAGCGALVMASSCAVYGEPAAEDLPLSENAPLKPGSPYAAAKLASEFFCRAFSADAGPTCVCLRYFNVYGPRQDPGSPYSGVISRFVEAASSGDACVVYGDGQQTRDFVYVGDVVAANLLALDAALERAPGGHVFNIGTGTETSVLGIAEALESTIGAPLHVAMKAARASDIRRSQADASLARRVLNFRPAVSFHEGLSRTWQWRRDGHAVDAVSMVARTRGAVRDE